MTDFGLDSNLRTRRNGPEWYRDQHLSEFHLGVISVATAMGVRLNEVSDQKDASPQRRRFRRTADGIVTELRLLSLRGDRGRVCAETVASVVLAVYLADIFNLKERWWVALSAFVLIRSNPAVKPREKVSGTIPDTAPAPGMRHGDC